MAYDARHQLQTNETGFIVINDIYLVQANFACPKSSASFRIYYRETVQFDQVTFGTNAVTEAVHARLSFSLESMMSPDYRLASFVGRKVFDGKEPKWQVDNIAGIGTRPTPGLPANNAALLGLGQITFSNRSNGRIFIPGISESDSTVGILNDAFVIGVFGNFRNAVVGVVSEISPGLGEWIPGVISRKILNANPPFLDWAGAFAPIVNGVPRSIIATQRRRSTSVEGAFI